MTAVFSTPIEVRFRDLDAMGHVNNAVYATYLEQTRAIFYDQVIGQPLHQVDTVLVHLEIDFKRPIEYGENVVIEMGFERIGTSSITNSYRVRTDDEIAATAETVQVVIDESGSASAVPDEWIDRIETFQATQ